MTLQGFVTLGRVELLIALLAMFAAGAVVAMLVMVIARLCKPAKEVGRHRAVDVTDEHVRSWLWRRHYVVVPAELVEEDPNCWTVRGVL